MEILDKFKSMEILDKFKCTDNLLKSWYFEYFEPYLNTLNHISVLNTLNHISTQNVITKYVFDTQLL